VNGFGAGNAARADDRKTVTITDEIGHEATLPVLIKAVYPDLWYQTEIVRAISAGNTIGAVDHRRSAQKHRQQGLFRRVR